ncbi:hypothetical protein ACU7M0_36300, partial [Burkholderia cenocepacia]
SPSHAAYAARETGWPAVRGRGLGLRATPITVAGDGVLALGGIVLLAVATIPIPANGGIRIM